MPLLPRMTMRPWSPARRAAVRLCFLGFAGWGLLLAGVRSPFPVSARFLVALELLVLVVLYLGFKAWRQAVTGATTVIAQYRVPRMQYLFALAFALQTLVFWLRTGPSV